jgi:hypothetical protein
MGLEINIAEAGADQDQLDSIKSLASSTEIPIVLIGTYELLALRNLSAQLSRRSVDVHFRRYRAEHSDNSKRSRTYCGHFRTTFPFMNNQILWRNGTISMNGLSDVLEY